MKIDLHCHSKYSHDNDLGPEELIQQALKRGLDGVCFTEHHSFMASLPVERIKRPEHFLVLRGLEISTDMGHMLVYGLKDDSWNRWSRNNDFDLFEVMEAVHDLGGICVAAHPFRDHDSFGGRLYKIEGFDAVETHNGLNSEQDTRQSLQAAHMKGLPSTGGSDCHNKRQVGLTFTEFDNPVKSIEDLVEEIREGNCRGREDRRQL